MLASPWTVSLSHLAGASGGSRHPCHLFFSRLESTPSAFLRSLYNFFLSNFFRLLAAPGGSSASVTTKTMSATRGVECSFAPTAEIPHHFQDSAATAEVPRPRMALVAGTTTRTC